MSECPYTSGNNLSMLLLYLFLKGTTSLSQGRSGQPGYIPVVIPVDRLLVVLGSTEIALWLIVMDI